MRRPRRRVRETVSEARRDAETETDQQDAHDVHQAIDRGA
jgi:hypothetical protein